MPNCPKCSKEITYLVAHSTVIETYAFSVAIRDNEEQCDWEHEDSSPCDNNDDDFCCPECNEPLFYSQEQAKDFLLKSVNLEKVS